MNKNFLKIAVLILVTCNLEAGATCQQSDFGSTERLVLLTNGNVLRGFVEQQFGTVIIHTAEGSRLVLSSDRIEKICESIEQALAEQRQGVQKDDVAGHRQLFHWCLKHNLLDDAQLELNQLQAMKLTASELNTLLQQLHSSIERNQQKDKLLPAAVSPPDNLPTPVIVPPEFEFAELPAPRQTNQSSQLGLIEIAPVSFEEAGEVRGSNSMIAGHELERIVKRLPNEGSSMFKKRIEPLVFRSCANAGCHDANRTAMPLMRLGRGEANPKRMSQQNLYRVLSYVGSGEVETSPLLIAAATPHGGASASPLNIDSDQYRMLAGWAAGMASPASSAGILPAISSHNQEDASLIADTPPIDARPLTVEVLPRSNVVTPKSGDSQATGIQPKVPVIPSLEKSHEKFLPKDPFDPEIYNRQFLKQSNSQKTIK